jgi:cell division protein FtsW (lipid II flippase)
MIEIRYHELVRKFLNDVCRQVKAKEMHQDIKMELESHIMDKVEEQLSAGIEQDDAIVKAIMQMGSPTDIGNQLHQTHKPGIEWSLLGFIIVFIVIGLLAMYAVELADPRRTNGTLTSKAIYSAIGIGLMFALRLWDYRKLLPYSWHLYRITLLAMGWVLLFGGQVNGTPYLMLGSRSIDFLSASPFLLIVFLAGIMVSKWKEQHFLVKILMYVIIPTILYLSGHSNASLLVYTAGFGILLFTIRKKGMELLLYGFPFAMLSIADLMMSPYKLERFSTFLNPYSAPLDAGYMTVQSIEAIQSAGWWGHGFAVSIPALPYIQSEMLFTYLIYSLGWVTGIAIWAAALFFLIRLTATARRVREPYGKLIVKGLLAIFAIQFVWSILMDLGLLPIFALSLPFMSHGGTLTLVQMAAIGIILGVYRQKNTIRSRTISENSF